MAGGRVAQATATLISSAQATSLGNLLAAA